MTLRFPAALSTIRHSRLVQSFLAVALVHAVVLSVLQGQVVGVCRSSLAQLSRDQRFASPDAPQQVSTPPPLPEVAQTLTGAVCLIMWWLAFAQAVSWASAVADSTSVVAASATASTASPTPAPLATRQTASTSAASTGTVQLSAGSSTVSFSATSSPTPKPTNVPSSPSSKLMSSPPTARPHDHHHDGGHDDGDDDDADDKDKGGDGKSADADDDDDRSRMLRAMRRHLRARRRALLSPSGRHRRLARGHERQQSKTAAAQGQFGSRSLRLVNEMLISFTVGRR